MSPHILLFKLCIDFFLFFFLLLLSALASILFYSILFLHNRLAVSERKAGLSQSCQLAMTHGNRHQKELSIHNIQPTIIIILRFLP